MPERLFALLIFCCSAIAAQAQQHRSDSIPAPETQRYRRIVGLNMTPLITQLIPLNRSNPREAGPFLVRFKKYGPKNRSAFRFSLGLHVVADDNGDVDDPQLNLAIGWEKRRSLGGRWAYTRGFDFMILTGDLNVPGSSSNEEVARLALGPVWGLEYFFDKRMSIGTEATLAVGFSPDSEFGVTLEIIPPVGVFLNHYF